MVKGDKKENETGGQDRYTDRDVGEQNRKRQ